jgi:hypothetical protein
MSHTCALCGQIRFNTYYEYEIHRAAFHGLKTAIKPERRTGRETGIMRTGLTPARAGTIVGDAEATWLKSHLVEIEGPLVLTASNEAVHLDACTCGPCFQKKLDALVERSDQRTRELLEMEAKRGTL